MAETVRRKIGLIAYSFSLQEGHEPNICNRKLAAEVERIVAYYEIVGGYEVVVVAQWEIALALRHVKPAYIVEEIKILGNDTSDTPEITAQAARLVFAPQGITRVILVAQPFMQIVKCWMASRAEGLRRIRNDHALMNSIGFDPDSDQVQCRGPIRCFVYSAIQLAGGLAAPKYEGGSGRKDARSNSLRKRSLDPCRPT